MRAAGQSPRFFMDRGLGSRIVPSLLRTAGWEVMTMDDRYGIAASQRVEDARWIAEASERSEVILCKDLAIARNQVEAEAVFRSDARVFGLANANLTGPTPLPDSSGSRMRSMRWRDVPHHPMSSRSVIAVCAGAA